VLYLVLLLVLAAFGLLIAALTTANTLWAWLSVVVSVVAAVLLVSDWLRGRRRFATRVRPPVASADPDHRLHLRDDPDERGGAENDPVHPNRGVDDVDEVDPQERTVALRHPPPQGDGAVPFDPGREPDEEDTDAADLLVVSGLEVEVRVLDERPRYHLSRCAWLAARPSIPLPLSEARQLGFTPCGVCTPDAVVSARHRAGRGARQPRS